VWSCPRHPSAAALAALSCLIYRRGAPEAGLGEAGLRDAGLAV
jgi:hypothetical protein